MDGTRLGITFQEAEAVLRNIRNKPTCNPRLPHQYAYWKENDIKGETRSYGCDSSITESSYFNTKLPIQRKSSDPAYFQSSSRYEKYAECPDLYPQKTIPETSLIAKRVEELKQSRILEKQDVSRTTFPAKRCTNFSPAEKHPQSTSLNLITSAEKSPSKPSNSKQQAKGQNPKVYSKSSNKKSAGNQMEITSYLSKVKDDNSDKINFKLRQSSIEDSNLAKSDKVLAGSVESMSLEGREMIKKKIFSASCIACTLEYVDGSTLLRPSKAKNPVKAIYFSFSGNVSGVPENGCCVSFPVPSLKENNYEYYQWLRQFFTNFMNNESHKVIYDAQKFIKTLIEALKFEDHTICFQWQCFDPRIASWLLDPDHPPEHYDALLTSGFKKEKISIDRKKLDKSVNDNQVCEDLLSLLSLIPDIFLALQDKNLWDLFSEVEMKISPILAVMELVGVEIDAQLLLDYGDVLNKKIRKLEQEGYKSVGHPFQMSSTHQLRQILFNELQLDKKVQKRLARTQIKNYKSTSENVLKTLQDFHSLPKIILEYRSVTKLKSAYVDGILNFVEDGVLHTNWNQTCTATGRLTSTCPNIQAIPKNQLDITGVTKQFIAGKEMETTSIIPRKAFKSRTGWLFVSSDFQSIELRLLAHFSEDPLLLRIFNESEEDIFVQLASIWLSIHPMSVQKEDRERAKRVVYSVIYGVGKERLADTLNVSADQAKSFTTSFLATFPGLQQFIQSCIKECRKQGFVTTISGRRRLLPGINSSDPAIRSHSERQAVNFVIQGSAADICKMGMILVVRSLNDELKHNARLLIQIHDELVLEVQDDYVQSVKELIKACLEDTNALCGFRVKLKVNMKVSVSCGKTWEKMQAV